MTLKSLYRVRKDGSLYKEPINPSSPPMKIFDPIEEGDRSSEDITTISLMASPTTVKK